MEWGEKSTVPLRHGPPGVGSDQAVGIADAPVTQGAHPADMLALIGHGMGWEWRVFQHAADVTRNTCPLAWSFRA